MRANGAVRLAVGALILAGCSSSEGFKAPASFTATEHNVSTLVTEAINKGEASPGLARGAPTVKCFYSKDSPHRCGEVAIRYTVKQATGIDFGQALVKPTRQIWKALFQAPNVEGGRIEVEGPTTSPGGITSTSSLFTLSCTRADARQINWDSVDASRLKTICKYQAYRE